MKKPDRDIKLLDEFAKVAKVWGYIEDQGVGSEVYSASADYDAAYRKLATRIKSLRRRATNTNAFLRGKIK